MNYELKDLVRFVTELRASGISLSHEDLLILDEWYRMAKDKALLFEIVAEVVGDSYDPTPQGEGTNSKMKPPLTYFRKRVLQEVFRHESEAQA